MKIARRRVPEAQPRRLPERFVAGTPARTAAELVGVSRSTATRVCRLFRERIVERLAERSPFEGETEVDESCFGGRRKGKRGRGAAGKVPALGILKRGGKVHTAIVSAVSRGECLPALRSRVLPDPVVLTDALPAYGVLDVSELQHRRIDRSKAYSEGDGKRVDGIENLWGQAKRRLRKYNGIPRESFPLSLKECGLPFNYGSPRELRETLERWMSEP